nr:hypothetical protein [Tanacetum cinerariifolium]
RAYATQAERRGTLTYRGSFPGFACQINKLILRHLRALRPPIGRDVGRAGRIGSHSRLVYQLAVLRNAGRVFGRGRRDGQLIAFAGAFLPGFAAIRRAGVGHVVVGGHVGAFAPHPRYVDGAPRINASLPVSVALAFAVDEHVVQARGACPESRSPPNRSRLRTGFGPGSPPSSCGKSRR